MTKRGIGIETVERERERERELGFPDQEMHRR
jgi:hypothetical protein